MQEREHMGSNIIENGNSSVVSPQSDVLAAENLLLVGLRHRWVILSSVVLFLAAGFLYLFKATPIYISTSKLYVEQTGPKIITEYEGVMTQSKNYLYTQAEMIRSTPIVANVVDNAEVSGFRTFGGVDNLVGYVRKNLRVSIGKKDDIVEVSFESPYPEEAAQIVNAIVDSYIGYQTTRKRSTVSQVLNILQKEKIKRDDELSEKFRQMLEFTRVNGVVSFDEKGGDVVLQRLAKLSEALTEAQLATVNAKADYEAVKSMSGEPAKIKQFVAASPTAGIRVFVNDTEMQLQTDLKNAEVELKDAMYHCTEDHPSVKAIHTKINQIKQQLNEEAKEFAEAYLEVMRLKWMTAKTREDELQASFDEQRKAAQDLGIKAAEYSVLKSELGRTERLCEILDNRIKELNVTEDAGALNISILEVARPPGGPSKPQKSKIMAIALILGFMFGCSLALVRDLMDYRLRSAEEVTAVLGVPVLGVVPKMTEEQTITDRSQKVWARLKAALAQGYQKMRAGIVSGEGAAEGTAPVAEKQTIIERARRVRSEFKSMSKKTYGSVRSGLLTDAVKGHLETRIVTSPASTEGKVMSEVQTVVKRGQKVHLKPKSVVAEAYRTIRTAVFFGVPKDEAKTIQVTSPEPGDGKSTLASNLAIAMAQAGQKILILDADLRKPMQHKIFEIDNTTGLSSVLAGAATLDEAIRPGPVKGLDVLPSGPDVPNPSEILNSDSFAKMLKSLSEYYDRVIIDSPPVTPIADGQILAAICDVVLLVLRAEKSSRRISQHARDGLLSVGARILGVIVNDVPQKRHHYGYYSGYGYYRGYGHYGGYSYYGNKGETKKSESKPFVSVG